MGEKLHNVAFKLLQVVSFFALLQRSRQIRVLLTHTPLPFSPKHEVCLQVFFP